MNQFRCRFKYQFALVVAMLSVFIHLKSQEQRIEITDINVAKYSTPVFALSTNLLYDATTSLNLGMEFKTGKRFYYGTS